MPGMDPRRIRPPNFFLIPSPFRSRGCFCGRRYRFYQQVTSTSEGRTWSAPKEMPGLGCARPRLLVLGDAVLLSGGRRRLPPFHTTDVDLWINREGGRSGTWQHFSVSGQHNLLEPNATRRFGPEVNSTSGPRPTSSYTALMRIGERSALLTYGRDVPAPRMGFAMRIDV